MFDPTIGKLALESATALLGHMNPETELALKDDPVLAWVTLAGETSLFDLIDNPDALPRPYAKKLHELAETDQGGAGPTVLGVARIGPFQEDGRRLRKDELRAPDRRRLALAARARILRRPGGPGWT